MKEIALLSSSTGWHIIIHYPVIGDADKTPADSQEWNAPYMSRQVDIFLFRIIDEQAAI